MGKTQESTRTMRALMPPPPAINQERWELVVKQLRFTPREADIVLLMLQARKDKQIAAVLGLRTPTVRMHLRHIFARLNISDRMELALGVVHLLQPPCPHCNGKSYTR